MKKNIEFKVSTVKLKVLRVNRKSFKFRRCFRHVLISIYAADIGADLITALHKETKKEWFLPWASSHDRAVSHLATKEVLDRMLLNTRRTSSWYHCTSVQVGGREREKEKKQLSFTGCLLLHRLKLVVFSPLIAQAVSFKSLCESCCQRQALGWWWDFFKHSLLESATNVKAICSARLEVTSSLNVLHEYLPLLSELWQDMSLMLDTIKRQNAEEKQERGLSWCQCSTSYILKSLFIRMHPVLKIWTKTLNSCNWIFYYDASRTINADLGLCCR